MNLEQDIISVIVPVYNLEQKLSICIESIINQSYKKIEIIIIDDGSVDNSSQIADEWGSKDSRIKVIHTVNGGVSAARNTGIKIAKGEYLLFVDGDDTLIDSSIKTLYSRLKTSDADIAIGGYRVIDDFRFCDEIHIKRNDCVTSQEAINMCLDGRFTAAPWGKLYKKSLFTSDNYYPLGRRYEDTIVMFRILLSATKVVFCDEAIYCYHINQENSSITNSPILKDIDDILQNYDELVKLLMLDNHKRVCINRYFYNKFICDMMVYLKRISKILNTTYKQEYIDRHLMDARKKLSLRQMIINKDFKYLFIKFNMLDTVDRILKWKKKK